MSDPRPRILLVEDNEAVRHAFGLLLGESGYRVLEAGTGARAIEVARAERPDLILMDLGLPDLGGLEVTRRLLADPDTHTLRIVALTGRALDSDHNACLDAGCVGYLAKPVDTERLLRSIPGFLEG